MRKSDGHPLRNPLRRGVLPRAGGAPSSRLRRSPRFERGDSVDVRGVEIFDRIVYFPVSINGCGPYPFVLDTGAGSCTALDERNGPGPSALRSTIDRRRREGGEEVVQFGLADSNDRFDAGALVRRPSAPDVPRAEAGRALGQAKGRPGRQATFSRPSSRASITNASGSSSTTRHVYEYAGPGERIPVTMRGNYILVPAEVLPVRRREAARAVFLLDTGVRLSVFNSPCAKSTRSPRRARARSRASRASASAARARGLSGACRGSASDRSSSKIPSCPSRPTTSGRARRHELRGDHRRRFPEPVHRRSRLPALADIPREERRLRRPVRVRHVRHTLRHGRESASICFKVFLVYDGTPAALAGIVRGGRRHGDRRPRGGELHEGRASGNTCSARGRRCASRSSGETRRRMSSYA